jgi:hypothetical protein
MPIIQTLDANRATAPAAGQTPDWRAEVDRMTSIEWSRMLDLFADANLYQTWSYGAVRWGRKNLSHLVLKCNGEVVAMAQLRIIRPANLRFGLAYLRWGPLCHRRGMQLNPEVTNRMAHALQEEYVAKRRLWLRVLPNAWVGSRRAELYESAFHNFSRAAGNADRTFVLDLRLSLEELRKKLDRKWRNQLSAAERNGLRVTRGRGPDEFRTFNRMYQQMRDRKSFDTSVDINEFGKIQESLPEHERMQILICEKEGVPVAGVVASPMGESAIYLLGATSDEGLKAKGSYLLQWTLIQWLKETGVQSYDVGGIDPERNPGVFHFKKGLSGDDVSFMPLLETCDSLFSCALVRGGMAIHNKIQRIRAIRAPNLKRRGTENRIKVSDPNA